MKISQFATDLDLEENGVWVDIGDGGQLLVARMGNPNYTRVVRELSKPYRSRIRKGTMPDEISDEILFKAMSQTILLGWSGIEDDKGKEIKYSSDAAYDLLKGMKDFRILVSELANEQMAFRREEMTAEGNS